MAEEPGERSRLNGHAVAPDRAAPDVPPPYPGLATFQASDAGRFFGRRTECRLVVANLRAARVTVVHGPSGVGKSSLLYAGVVPALEALDPAPPVVVVSRWDGGTLPTLSAEMDRASGREAPLLILDQFEEYLRHADAPVFAGIEEALGEIAGSYAVRARILISVREDQFAGLDRFEGAIPDIFGNVLRLDPLSRGGAREAIEEPLERWNAVAREHGAQAVCLEPGLTEQILDELTALSRDGMSPVPDRVAPPLLALTMRRLWDADVGGGGTTLKRATLASLGGADNILATHLDAALDALPAHEQRLAADMFRYLVTPSGVCRPLTARDLAGYIDTEPPRVEALAEKLARPPARILRAASRPGATAAGTEYELAHDVLAAPASEWEARYRTRRLEGVTRRLILTMLAVAITALGVTLDALAPGPVRRLEGRTVDARFAIRGPKPPNPSIIIVTEGDTEYTRLHSPRDVARLAYAQAIDRIARAGARVIALDIFFDRAKSPVGDLALIGTMYRYRDRVVFGADMLNVDGEVTAVGRPDQIFTDTSSPAAGYVGFPGDPNDPHTVIRTMDRGIMLPGGYRPLQSFGVVVARMAAGLSQSEISTLPKVAWIDFRGGAGTYPTVPLAAVLARSPAALAQLRGRIVLLGITAAVKGDVHDTSAPGHGTMTGTEIQANAVATALERFPLRSPGGWLVDLTEIVVLGLLPLLLTRRLAGGRLLAATLGLAVLFLLGAQLAFFAGWVVAVVVPLGTLLLSGLTLLSALLWGERRRRAETSHTNSAGGAVAAEPAAATTAAGPVTG